MANARWLLVALIPVGATRLAGQASGPTFQVRARLQSQFYWFDNDEHRAAAGPTGNFLIRRARIEVYGRLRDDVNLVIMPSFEGGRSTGLRLRDAFLDVRLTPARARTALTLRMGQEKKPFQRYEIMTSNNLPSLERPAFRGLLPTGSNNLFERAGYLAHDVGAALTLTHSIANGRTAALKVGVYNGQGESVNDVNDAKSIGLRATVDVTGKLGLGASFFSHDGVVALPAGPDSAFRNQAFGLEAQWGRPGDAGFFGVADYMQGEDFTESRRTMRGLSLVTAYHLRTPQGKSWLYAVEPAFRLDLADPDTDGPDDGSTLLTAGVNLYLTASAQIRVMLEHQNPRQPGLASITGLRTAVTMNFSSGNQAVTPP